MVSFLEGRPQNVAACQSVVSEAKSAQKPPAPPGFLSISRKQFLRNLDLEINAGARVHAWVDSMRASSPTHIKSSTPSIADDGGSWNVYNFVKLAELYYAGSHGMDIKGPQKLSKSNQDTELLFQPASEFLPMIDEVYKQLVETTKSTPGAKVENNKFCLSVHFRCVDEKKWSELAQQVKSVLKEYPKLRLTQGRKVLEIRPTIKWDKGKALEFLLESLGFADCTDVFPVYIGDDRTDEDAFKILRDRGQGFGILVSKFPKDTSASYSLQEPDEVMDFLRRLVEWKELSVKTQLKM
ncbi:hypothetical protein V6N13_111345 [Hibiscus sabdariffa]